MAKICTSVSHLIGRMPLLELTAIEGAEQLNARLLAKPESFSISSGAALWGALPIARRPENTGDWWIAPTKKTNKHPPKLLRFGGVLILRSCGYPRPGL